MCKLLSYVLMFFYLAVSSSSQTSLQAMEMELEQTIAEQLIKKMKETNTDVCVIGFNAGRANCFLHINKTRQDMIIVDCGAYYSNKPVDNKSTVKVSNLNNKVKNILQNFISKGYQLKHVIISHEHRDHKNIWDDVLNTFFPSTDVIRTSPNDNATDKTIDGKVIDSIKFIKVSGRGSIRENSKSLVCYIDGMIYMGDLDEGELDFSVLKGYQIYGMVFPHHGSVTNKSRNVRNQVMEHQLKSNKTPIKFIFISNNLENRTKVFASRDSLACQPSPSASTEHITDANKNEIPRHVIVTNDTDVSLQRALANVVLYKYEDIVYRAVIYDDSYEVSQQLEEISSVHDSKQENDPVFN